MNHKAVATILILALATVACGQAGEIMSDVAGTLEATTIEAPEESEATVNPAQGGSISQWAISAVASSEYGTSDWSAMQATGAPDTPECGDQTTAWASATSGTVEWIELTYSTPVKPTEVNIIQTYNPNQVIVVELIDTESAYHEIYAREPELSDECPYALFIPMVDFDYVVTGIRITIDQSASMSWNEIDAVELVGIPAEE